jgi:hypothetical protein
MDIIDLSPPGHQPRSLVVFLRARKDGRGVQYYARRLVPPQFRKTPRNPYATKALGAVSLERARELAWQWWTSTEQKSKQQQSFPDTTFSTISESYLQDLEIKATVSDNKGRPVVNPRKYTRQKQSIRLHLKPFFGPMTVGSILLDDAERWLEWRFLPHQPDGANDDRRRPAEIDRTQVPARSTVQKDAVAFAGVVRHARLHFKVDTRFIPDLPVPPQTRIRGDRGSIPMNGSASQRRSVIDRWWFRIMLFYFVKTLHGTGLRVAEGMRLKVKHLRRNR